MPHKKLWLMLLLAATGSAQTRYHFGDDTRWADPNFDDSSWTVAGKGRWQIPPFNGDGFVWVRTHLRVPVESSGQLAVGLNAPPDTTLPPMEILVNGKIVGRIGNLLPRPSAPIRPATTVFDLAPGSAATGQTAVVGLRIWYPRFARFNPGASGSTPEIGSRELLRLRESKAIAQLSLSALLNGSVRVGFLLAGIVLLIIWRVGRGSPELFWFGIFLAGKGIHGIWSEMLPDLFRLQLSLRAWALVRFTAQWFADGFALFEFQWAAFKLRRRWPLRLLEITAGVGFALIFLSLSARREWVLLFASAWPVALVGIESARILISLWQFRRPSETWGVAAAIAIGSVVQVLTGGVVNTVVIPRFIHLGSVSVSAQVISLLLFVIAVIFMLLRRFWQTWHRTRELDAEFEAARETQRLLVPPPIGAVGFKVASAYVPARQVGGDFFWTVPAANGSLLLVAGDVSGKGLKAALTVATLAGALRNEPSREPAQVLASLNAVLLGHGGTGFTTCCAALFQADGRVVIANAGHIPPYRNEEEVPVKSGLPLGIIAQSEYSETALMLQPGDRMTFVSDGVVEARHPDGELYGFERTRDLITQSAARIAETAQAFGQEDDISVITIERTREAAAYV